MLIRLSPGGAARGLRTQRFAFLGGGVLVGSVAAVYVARAGETLPMPLIGLLAVAGGIVLFSLQPQHLFLGWLFAAPLLQESADGTTTGHVLVLALYLAPPVALAGHLVLERGGRPRLRWFDALPALYVVYVFASMAVTTDLLTTAPVDSVKSALQTVAIGVLVYYFVAFGPGRTIPAARIIVTVLLAAVLQASLAIVEWASGWNLWGDYGWREDIPRSIGTLANPAILGAFLGAGIVTSIAILCWRGPRRLHFLARIVLLLGFPALLTTYTRGPILAAVLVGAVSALLSGRSRLVAVGAIAVAGMALVLAWPRITTSEVYQRRAAQTENIRARLLLQDWSLRLAAQKPITGWGYGSFDRAKREVTFEDTGGIPVAYGLENTSHNTYLTVLVEYGGVGILLLLLPWAVVVLRGFIAAFKPSADRWVLVAAISSLMVIVITAATLDLRFFSFLPMLPWLFLALMRRLQSQG